MRKNAFMALALALAVAAGGFAVTWFLQAKQLKKTLEVYLARLSETAPGFRYEAIEMSGFPSEVSVSIVNPRFTGRVDEVLKTIAEHEGSTRAFSAAKSWEEDVALNGAITFSINAFSNRYGARIRGEWHEKGMVGDTPTALTLHAEAESQCVLEMKRASGLFGPLWSYELLEDRTALVKAVRALDCVFPAHTLADAASGEIFMQSAGTRFYLSHEPGDADWISFRLYLQSDANAFTVRGDDLMALYMRAFVPGRSAVRYSLYGKQNLLVDMSYAGRENTSPPEFELRVEKFNFTSDLHSLKGHVHALSKAASTGREGKLNLRFSASFAPEFREALLETLTDILEEARQSADPKLVYLQPYVQRYSLEQARQIIGQALPDLHSLGVITQAVDYSVQGSADFTKGQFSLNELELSTGLYGLSGKGNGSRTDGQMFPQANLTLACRQCLVMIDDAAAYSARLSEAVAAFDAELGQRLLLSPAKAQGLKNFLSALAPPAEGNLQLEIVSGEKGFTVNGHALDEMVSLYHEHVADAGAGERREP